jgi:two-component system alkaline phosphatase synthesis response regulator PhoP
MARIVVVDDERTLLATLRFNLEREGHEVFTAADGEDAHQLIEKARPDLLLLDLLLPGMHGFELCRIVRKKSQIPIMILTARTEEVDRVVGLELGADDYLTKPFSMPELIARVNALLRRSRNTNKGNEERVIVIGPLAVDLLSREAYKNERPLDLRPKEFELLATFARHPGQTLSREQLLAAIWKYEGFGSTRTVDVHVGRLRSKIEDNPNRPAAIITVRGIGYRFNA